MAASGAAIVQSNDAPVAPWFVMPSCEIHYASNAPAASYKTSAAPSDARRIRHWLAIARQDRLQQDDSTAAVPTELPHLQPSRRGNTVELVTVGRFFNMAPLKIVVTPIDKPEAKYTIPEDQVEQLVKNFGEPILTGLSSGMTSMKEMYGHAASAINYVENSRMWQALPASHRTYYQRELLKKMGAIPAAVVPGLDQALTKIDNTLWWKQKSEAAKPYFDTVFEIIEASQQNNLDVAGMASATVSSAWQNQELIKHAGTFLATGVAPTLLAATVGAGPLAAAAAPVAAKALMTYIRG